jgi:hypothetical protein
MLDLALKSHLPLVTVYTDDPVNVGAVLQVIAGDEVKVTPYSPQLKTPTTGVIQYALYEDGFDWKKAYTIFNRIKGTLVVVNATERYPGAFDAGVLVTPPEMIERFVSKYGSKEHHAGLMAAMSGLSFEQVYQISKLAMAKHGEFTPRSVRDIRRSLFGMVRGLQMLSTEFFYYDPPEVITDWLAREGRFLTVYDEPMLTPRGLLFNGPPGTGKTMGAKYIAKQLDLPLYHLDIAGLMEKYVGESESNLRIALKQAENSAPCVMLIDEVEKLFSGVSDDSGVTSRMLSTILWWLQEHKAKVFTIMTTNKEANIPPELYRPGRIDSEINFKRLDAPQCYNFEAELAKRIGATYDLEWKKLVGEIEPPASHAAITQNVLRKAKLEFLKKEG